MARVVIGGLISSTLITLILVPVIYAILEGRKHAKTISEDEPSYSNVPQFQAGD
jgi:HAE1 family hydrophobic/amphiphilic exporter-1